MKKTRKLIPALAMLLLSAVMLSTASFAWFSMNTSVELDPVIITAVSNAPGLTVDLTMAENTSLFPMAPVDTGELKDIANGGNAITTAKLETATNWYYKFATGAGTYTQNYNPSTESLKTKYLAIGTIKVTLATSGDTMNASSISCKAVFDSTKEGSSALKLVLIPTSNNVTATSYFVSKPSSGTEATVNLSETLAPTAETAAEVTYAVYAYIDGNDTTIVTPSDTTDFAGIEAGVTLTFTMAAPTQGT